MKNAFGATLLFQIVIFFVIVFTGYICLSINQAKAFNVKNEILKVVERHAPDLDSGPFKNEIKNIIETQGYRLDGNCESLDDGYTGYDRNGEDTSNGRGSFCVKEISSKVGNNTSARYYKIVTFYQLDLPVFNSLFNLTTSGETKLIIKKR